MRWAPVAAALVFLSCALVWLAHDPRLARHGFEAGSSLSTAPEGLSLARAYLARQGTKVGTLTRPISEEEPGGALLVTHPEAGLPLFLVSAAVFAGFGLRVWLGDHYVSVVGRRSKARMVWHWRPRRAREVFDLLRQRVRERQAQSADATPLAVTEAPAEASGEGRPLAP